MANPAYFSDLHVHTHRSLCAPRTTEPETYLPHCEGEGIRVLGFSDHVYPDEFIHQFGYHDQTRMSRLLSLAPVLEQAQKETDVKLLFGCEIDYFAAVGAPYISPEESLNFDYVLFASSHILNYPHMYTEYDLQNPDVLRRLTIERFVAACRLDYPVPMGICHPLYPICSPYQAEIIDGISDACLDELFCMAREKGISIEVHACLYRKDTPLNADGLSEHYLRILSAAKKAGCKFHFGSDAHDDKAFVGSHQKLFRAAEIVGITEDDLWDVAKGIVTKK